MNKTTLSAKEYLSRAYRIDRRIDSKLEQVMRLRSLASKATATFSGMPRPDSPNVHSMEAVIMKIFDLENEINRDIDVLVDTTGAVMAVIRQVKHPEYQFVLEQRHLCFKSWEQIAVSMGYSIQHTYRIHDQALNAVTALMNESSCD